MTLFESGTLWWMKLEIFRNFSYFVDSSRLRLFNLGGAIIEKAMEKQFDPELNISREFTYEEAEPKIEVVVAINSGLIPVKIIMGEVEFCDSKEPEKMMTREKMRFWDFSLSYYLKLLDQNRKYIALVEEFRFSFGLRMRRLPNILLNRLRK